MRLIDVDELIKKAYSETEGMDKPYKDLGIVLEWLVNKMPTIEQKKGKWIDLWDHCVCNQCGHTEPAQYDGVQPIPNFTPYCSNCGADMREEEL